MARATVVLFDVDGTLITCGGAGRRAMERAFRERLGRDDVCDFPFGGMTDRAIVRRAFEAAEQLGDEPSIDAFLERYLAHLADELCGSLGYGVYPGVNEVLGALEGHEAIAVGLGTGNVEIGARAKLRPGSLDEHFAFGGFGCDHEDRARLLEVGAVRGAARLDVARDACRVIIVGDTPHDVAAARAIGAECVVVRTGWSKLEDLVAAAPDLLVDDLTDPRALQHLLG